MRYKITAPSHIDTTINLPASKSISNRALILHALGKGSVVPDNLSDCDDTKVIINALKTMPPVIDIKAAGTAMRFMTAYLSVTPGEHVITGTDRMKHRPIRVLVDALRKLGAQIEYTEEEGFPPLRITGDTLDGGMLEIPGDVSSQYISALLMIGPAMKNGLKLRLTGNIVSRPYIDLTLHVMHEFGISVEWTDVDMISVSHQEIGERRYTIENDWSASSYWYEILAMINDDESRVTLPGLKDASRQGDSAVRYLFSMLGVKTAFRTTNEVVLTRHMCSLPRLDYDFINQPDLAQTLVVTCATLGIPFHFTGLGNLRIKETDRIEAMKTEMRKLGYVLDDSVETELSWNGERCEAEEKPVIDTYEDHRMAMAFAPTAILLGEIRINNPEVVTKSYPGYWDDLRKAGFTIEEI
ncbi:3-phosphoshikimate 1-carboxyvinyltransferase [uncultured Prevotella sp.]|uniref:3-phosphoshikimate 1-carboxyvinyltransferase n=1 Tax=uncultured Prevotella sp. TaxID=159272 RepID=UPI002584985A|nr:3-phosphoshikimate 1-carboxyvinyltransferase [uncultured Prevotella sp.]